MKYAIALAASVCALALTQRVSAQMMSHGYGMGGGPRTTINLVSPAESAVQIGRGMLMVGPYMSHMNTTTMGPQSSSGMDMDDDDVVGVSVTLRLIGVSDREGRMTTKGKPFRLRVTGEVTPAPADSDPEDPAVIVETTFDVKNGAALVRVPLNVDPTAAVTTVLLGEIEVLYGDTGTDQQLVAVPGVVVTQPQRTPKPTVTPVSACHGNSECDDNNSATRDVCMFTKCFHMPNRMGPSGGPMM